QQQYLQDVESFVMTQLKDMAETYATASPMIYSLLESAYLSLAAGYADEYASYIRNASIVYQAYQKDKDKDPEGRRALPTFVQMQANGLMAFVLNPQWPLAMRSGVWLRVPSADVKHPIYDLVLPELTQQC